MKKIGIPAWAIGENSFGVSKSYLYFITEAIGADPIILYPSNPVDTRIDLLLLGGGADVSPLRYNALPSIYCQNSNIHLEYFDKVRLPEYISAGIPIFGICRGMQTLNVHFGGKLVQHMSHETNIDDRGSLVHDVYNPKNPSQRFGVNSMHHQCVNEEKLSKEFYAKFLHIPKLTKNNAGITLKGDGTVEGIIHKTLPIIAVQWHPEEIFDTYSLETITRLMNTSSNATTTKNTILEHV